MKPKEIEVKSVLEFQELIDNKSFNISQAIVESILRNIKTRKKNIHILSVRCIEENTVFDITLDKNNFSETLKENLPYFEIREKYSDCAKIKEAINFLSK